MSLTQEEVEELARIINERHSLGSRKPYVISIRITSTILRDYETRDVFPEIRPRNALRTGPSGAQIFALTLPRAREVAQDAEDQRQRRQRGLVLAYAALSRNVRYELRNQKPHDPELRIVARTANAEKPRPVDDPDFLDTLRKEAWKVSTFEDAIMKNLFSRCLTRAMPGEPGFDKAAHDADMLEAIEAQYVSFVSHIDALHPWRLQSAHVAACRKMLTRVIRLIAERNSLIRDVYHAELDAAEHAEARSQIRLVHSM